MVKKKYIDIKFIDATSYYPLDHLSSGGTRVKRVLENINGKQFFFKESEKKEATKLKPEKHYVYEFFNEIIAFQLGKQLGLDMLRYDIAIFGDAIGCISPRMNNLEKGEQLIEFGKYMIAINPDFNPESEEGKKYQNRKEYTFQLLEKSFDFFEHKQYIQFIFKVLIFDSIIGNVDRHQENWAFITAPNVLPNDTEQFEGLIKKDVELGFIKKLVKKITNVNHQYELNQIVEITHLTTAKVKKTAPIYDSGSSLGRELTEEKIEILINDESALDKYITKGQAELHWHQQKHTHYELLKKLLNSDLNQKLINESGFLYNYYEGLIEKIINRINKKLPKEWEHYKIPDTRKILISKIVSLRINALKNIFGARI